MTQATLLPSDAQILLRYRVPGLADGPVRFRWSDAERGVFRKRRKQRVSEWVERHINLTKGPRPGPWRNSSTPYLVGVMDALGFASVQDVVLCKSPQVGGSEVGNNFLGFVADQDQGDALVVYPDQGTAEETSRDRIQPMFEHSPRLRACMTADPDDASKLRIALRGMIIYMAWAHSAARLASKPIRYLILEEVDKYPRTASKREADPVSLAKKRQTTFRHNRKCLELSTPTTLTGRIWTSFTREVQARFDYWVRCPGCGHWQRMEFDRIRWPKDVRDPVRVETEELAWYECAGPACGECWTDAHRDQAVRLGEWRERETGLELGAYLRGRKPRKVGFHIPAWLSTFVSLSRCASAFLAGQKASGNPDWKEKLKDFMNAIKAEPWEDYEVERDSDAILKLRDERPRGVVPSGFVVAGLTAGVDSQDDGFVYEIRAWGWGRTEESWQIREGKVQTLEALEQVLFEDRYEDARGERYVVQLALIDAMGHRTREVYEWARTHVGRVWPLKGEQRMNQPFAFSNIDYWPGTKIPIPGGLQLLRINTNYYKSALASKLAIAPADPGAWHLHSECAQAWAEEMCAEYVDERGLWQCPKGKDNHAWDVSVYALAAADVLGIKFWEREKAEEPATAEDDTPRKTKRRLW
jgi:phage terminase large subunit GpA-like protein